MVPYILRRLFLMIPTLLGIMVLNFALTQFVPGGPVDQVLAQLEGEGDVFSTISGGGSTTTLHVPKPDIKIQAVSTPSLRTTPGTTVTTAVAQYLCEKKQPNLVLTPPH